MILNPGLFKSLFHRLLLVNPAHYIHQAYLPLAKIKINSNNPDNTDILI